MKMGGYIIVMVSMIMFLELLAIPTGADNILTDLGININETTGKLVSADMESSSLFNFIFNTTTGILIVISAAATVIIGFFGKGYDTSLIILPFVTLVGTTFMGTIWKVIQYMINTISAPSWSVAIISIILVGVGIGFIMSCIDYFAGR